LHQNLVRSLHHVILCSLLILSTLTSLTCSCIKSINGTDLSLIANYFPLLEELDLSYPKKLENYESFLNGVEAISSTLFKLRKVNLSYHYYINNQLLVHLFKNWKLLEEAVIFGCNKITNTGIALALHETPTLRSLSLSSYFEPVSLLPLVSNNPSLSEIIFDYTSENSVENSNFLKDIVVSPQLKSLDLTLNYWLVDESIKIFVSSFPNLQLLNLSHCCNISEEAICHVLKRCHKIRHLDLTYCEVKLHGLNFEVPNLEVLNLSYTYVDDEALKAISMKCRGLLQLSLEDCCNVREKGVKHVIENCTQLREINLKGCDKVHSNIVALMVFSRPSLRKITAPPHYCFDYEEMKVFSRQGCLVY